jgi:hypothetical protein
MGVTPQSRLDSDWRTSELTPPEPVRGTGADLAEILDAVAVGRYLPP